MAGGALVARPSAVLISFDDEKLRLIRNVISKDLTEDEFRLFISIATSRGLDPVLNQIHAVKRNGKVTFQVAIDGFRLIASRTGEHAGTDEIEYAYNQKDEIISARCCVYRVVGGQRCAFAATVFWEEFYPREEKMAFMWNKMPHVMLGKCAEAQALRKAFPGDMSGLYEPSEMQQDAQPVTNQVRDVSSAFDDEPHQKAIRIAIEKFAKLGVTEFDILRKCNVLTKDQLTPEHLTELGKIGTEIVNKRLTKAEAFPAEEKF